MICVFIKIFGSSSNAVDQDWTLRIGTAPQAIMITDSECDFPILQASRNMETYRGFLKY